LNPLSRKTQNPDRGTETIVSLVSPLRAEARKTQNPDRGTETRCYSVCLHGALNRAKPKIPIAGLKRSFQLGSAGYLSTRKTQNPDRGTETN